MAVPSDIVREIEKDFEDEDERELANSVIADLAKDQNAQILRCVVFLAKGDLERLEEFEKLARIDSDGLIFMAEISGDRKVHDFKKKFKKPQKAEDKESATLREALKAFRKRLKVYRLDEESRIGGSKVTKGESSSICAISPPTSYPQEVWDKLVELGHLREVEDKCYELND